MTDKEPVVNFFRYVRPYKNGEIDNLRGVTLLFHLDYETRILQVAYAICNGDNFSKASGRLRAKREFALQRNLITLPIPKNGIQEEGCVKYVADYVWEYFNRSEQLFKQFKAAGYYLFYVAK